MDIVKHRRIRNFGYILKCDSNQEKFSNEYCPAKNYVKTNNQIQIKLKKITIAIQYISIKQFIFFSKNTEANNFESFV